MLKYIEIDPHHPWPGNIHDIRISVGVWQDDGPEIGIAITVEETSMTMMNDEGAVVLPINGELDLHAFRPGEVESLLVVYLGECRKMGISEVRIIHGKGDGTLRRTVHAVLQRLPGVVGFRLAGEDGGGWGATLVNVLPTVEEGH